jgi:flagellar basal-body rod protein FlgF
VADGIYIATAGAVAQSAALDVTAHNISNASTGAFQGSRVTFTEALAKAQSPDVALVGNSTSAVDTTPGPITQTGNALDIALDGEGYFAVQTPNGTRYSRAGALTRDTAGTIVTSDGHAVKNAGGGNIVIPEGATQISITAEGAIIADGDEIGRLELARFDAKQLKREGATLLSARGKPAEGPAPQVMQGALEGSNVNVVRGVVDLVKVSRTYESLLRIIEGYSEINSRAARDIGGPK